MRGVAGRGGAVRGAAWQSKAKSIQTMKRVLVMSDTHCGHVVGLTPPGYQLTHADQETYATKRDKFVEMQRSCWEFYSDTIQQHGPFDVVICNGDLIDGAGVRSGGTEQSTTDRLNQCEIAERCIREAMSKRTKVFMTVGTGYHTGEAEDFEAAIARNIGAEKIGSHEWIAIDDVVFDAKHHCGSSSVPHGRHTAIARDRLWNVLWAERGQQPKAHVIIRSHVHYYNFCGGPGYVCMTTPALQGFGTKYGSRRCSGIVDFGVIVFEVDGDEYKWTPILCDIPALAAQVIKV